MMHNDDRTIKGIADSIGRLDVCGRVTVTGFGAGERAGERVEHDRNRRLCPEVGLDRLNKTFVISDKVHLSRDQVERRAGLLLHFFWRKASTRFAKPTAPS